MLTSEIALNSQNMPAQNMPEGYVRNFDAHIYYETQSRALAASLRELALKSFEDSPVLVGPLIDRKVGPHPTPMFEINFPNSCLGELVLWLMDHRKTLSVLVHRVSGDDPKDHSEGALWLGPSLQLDASKLDPSPLT